MKDDAFKMRFVDKKTIKLDKVLNELDKFVLRFVKILEKHTDYVIVSGYVVLLFGRSRATEDVDIFIKELNKAEFGALYKDLKKQGYWCLNAEDADEVYDYLAHGSAVRFAIKNETIPNFEVKFAKKRLQAEALKDTIVVITKLGKINISSIERQIAFKRYYLKTDKDLEDATHMEELFKGHIDTEKIGYYKKIVENEKS